MAGGIVSIMASRNMTNLMLDNIRRAKEKKDKEEREAQEIIKNKDKKNG